MNIAVTGGAGFIGSHVVDAFIEAGHRVIVIDDLSSGYRRNLNPKAEFYELSINDDKVEEIFKNNKIDVLDHHAAQIDVRKSIADPSYDAKTNVLGAVKLLEYCRKYNVKKVIYSSTGGAIYGEPEYLPADEKHPILPISAYGVSKFCYEKYIEYYHRLFGLDYTILRYANVYGPRQDPHGEAGVVAIFSGLLLQNKECIIFGDGESTRDYVYVGDLAKANLIALEKGSGEIINLGTEKETSVNELYERMRKITGVDLEAVHKPERTGEVNRIYLKIGHAEEILGWKPEMDLDKGLETTVNFFRELTAKV